MIELKRGQRSTLSALGLGSSFSVVFTEKTDNPNIDISIFVTDRNKKILSDDYIIFYGKKKSPCSSVSLQSDCDKNTVSIDIDRLPIEAKHIHICLTFDGAYISSLHECIISFQNEQTIHAIFRFPLVKLTHERSLIIVELYKKNEWRCACVAQGFVNGALEYLVRHFGGEVIDNPTQSTLERVSSSSKVASQSINASGNAPVNIPNPPPTMRIIP